MCTDFQTHIWLPLAIKYYLGYKKGKKQNVGQNVMQNVLHWKNTLELLYAFPLEDIRVLWKLPL